MIPFSVLDLCPIIEGGNAADALSNTLDLARKAEGWGYKRFWLAEHHNMPGIASAATAVVIGYVAGGTRSIRVGAGGVMLPNHSPLIIAEQFGTLESLYPGRIDLGLGRAPGTDPRTTMALRRDMGTADTFPEDVVELETYFSDHPGRVRAVPGTGLKVPLYLLGSSLFSAQLAAAKGLPFAFASHFAPQLLDQALRVYRELFQPSQVLSKPYAIVGAPLFAADTDEQGQLLLSSMQRQFINLRRGVPGKLQPPEKNLQMEVSREELHMANQALSCAIAGSPASVEASLQALIQRTQADEIVFAAHIYDHRARLRAYEIAAEVRQRMTAGCV